MMVRILLPVPRSLSWTGAEDKAPYDPVGLAIALDSDKMASVGNLDLPERNG